MKTLSVNKTKLINLFISNAMLSKAIAKWTTKNTIITLSKISLIMPLTRDDKPATFASPLR